MSISCTLYKTEGATCRAGLDPKTAFNLASIPMKGHGNIQKAGEIYRDYTCVQV